MSRKDDVGKLVKPWDEISANGLDGRVTGRVIDPSFYHYHEGLDQDLGTDYNWQFHPDNHVVITNNEPNSYIQGEHNPWDWEIIHHDDIDPRSLERAKDRRYTEEDAKKKQDKALEDKQPYRGRVYNLPLQNEARAELEHGYGNEVGVFPEGRRLRMEGPGEETRGYQRAVNHALRRKQEIEQERPEKTVEIEGNIDATGEPRRVKRLVVYNKSDSVTNLAGRVIGQGLRRKQPSNSKEVRERERLQKIREHHDVLNRVSQENKEPDPGIYIPPAPQENSDDFMYQGGQWVHRNNPYYRNVDAPEDRDYTDDGGINSLPSPDNPYGEYPQRQSEDHYEVNNGYENELGSNDLTEIAGRRKSLISNPQEQKFLFKYLTLQNKHIKMLGELLKDMVGEIGEKMAHDPSDYNKRVRRFGIDLNNSNRRRDDIPENEGVLHPPHHTMGEDRVIDDEGRTHYLYKLPPAFDYELVDEEEDSEGKNLKRRVKMARTPDESEGVDEMGRLLEDPGYFDPLQETDQQGRKEGREGKPMRRVSGRYTNGYAPAIGMEDDDLIEEEMTRYGQRRARRRRDQEQQ